MDKFVSIDMDRPNFAGLASGFDLTIGISDQDMIAIERAMDYFAVLVFRSQRLNDDQQLAFSRRFGELETATGDLTQGAQRRLGMELNDISNLDRNGEVVPIDVACSGSATGSGTATARSRPFRPNIHSCPPERCPRGAAAIPSSPTCARLTMR